MPGRSSGPRRQWKGETAISRRCSTTIAACPCDAIRCGRCCTISIVGPRTGRHRRRGFSGGRFPICSRVCCHRSTCCPCQGNVVRPSRQVLEEAGCPALNGCPLLVPCIRMLLCPARERLTERLKEEIPLGIKRCCGCDKQDCVITCQEA